MQIVILAAGRGTRMGNLTDFTPKPMLKIKGKAILAYKLEALPAQIDEVIFIIGYLGNKIKEYFGDSYAGKKISYLVQNKLDGSGGAIALAENILKDDFLVMNGDDLYKKEDIEKLASFDLAVLTMEIENASQFGTVSIDENGNLNGIIEKQGIEEKASVNTGLYKLNKNFFKYKLVSIGNGESGLPQTLVTMKDEYIVKAISANDWFAIGNPADLKKAENIIDKFI